MSADHPHGPNMTMLTEHSMRNPRAPTPPTLTPTTSMRLPLLHSRSTTAPDLEKQIESRDRMNDLRLGEVGRWRVHVGARVLRTRPESRGGQFNLNMIRDTLNLIRGC